MSKQTWQGAVEHKPFVRTNNVKEAEKTGNSLSVLYAKTKNKEDRKRKKAKPNMATEKLKAARKAMNLDR